MMMSRFVSVLVVGASFLSGGCASIVHSGPRSIPVASTPPGAKVSIYDRDNAIVSTHTTPFTAKLSSKYGYFKGQNYRLVFEMPGYAPSEVAGNRGHSSFPQFRGSARINEECPRFPRIGELI